MDLLFFLAKRIKHYVFMSFTCFGLCATLLFGAQASAQIKVIGYLPANGNVIVNFDKIDLKKLTHINLASLNPKANGDIMQGDNPACMGGVSAADIRYIVQKAHQSGVKVLVSLAGRDVISSCAGNWVSLLSGGSWITLADSIVQFVYSFGLDGVDVDIDAGLLFSLNNNGDNYTPFISFLKGALGPKLLTATSPTNAVGITIPSAAFSYLDFVSILSLDYAGPSWGAGQEHSPFYRVSEDMNFFAQQGLRKEQIVLGIPAYGYGFNGYAERYDYKEIAAQFGSAAVENSDLIGTACVGCKYITFNGPKAIQQKFPHVMGLGSGLAVFDLSGDTQDKTSLVSTIYELVKANTPASSSAPSSRSSSSLSSSSRSSSTPSKFQTINFLNSVRGLKMVGGVHNIQPNAPDTSSLWLERLVGQRPGLYSAEFVYPQGDQLNREQVVNQAIVEWSRGAMVHLQWKACNPAKPLPCGGELFDKLSNDEWDKLITSGTEINNNWKHLMDDVAVHLQQLENAGVEVLFNPLELINESFFWWGSRRGTNGSARLYQITHDYLTNVKGLSNLMWVLTLRDANMLEVDLHEFNPGNNNWDVLAVDFGEADFFDQSKYNATRTFADAAAKPFGLESSKQLPSYSDMVNQPMWSYFIGWPEVLQRNDTTQLLSFYSSDRVLMLYELPGWKKMSSNASSLRSSSRSSVVSSSKSSAVSSKNSSVNSSQKSSLSSFKTSSSAPSKSLSSSRSFTSLRMSF
jgi:mannan endo-1,4-beta-mannosidase